MNDRKSSQVIMLVKVKNSQLNIMEKYQFQIQNLRLNSVSNISVQMEKYQFQIQNLRLNSVSITSVQSETVNLLMDPLLTPAVVPTRVQLWSHDMVSILPVAGPADTINKDQMQ